MRLVRVPIPRSAAAIAVRKPAIEHMTLPSLLAGDRRTAADAFAKRLRQAYQALPQRGERDGWDVLWATYVVGPWIGFERAESLTFHVDGDEADDLVVQLRDALAQAGLDPIELGTASPARGAVPIRARWGRYVFGPGLGLHRARLVADHSHREVVPEPIPEITCPVCGEVGRPVQRWQGLPVPDAVALCEALGEPLDLLGCLVDPDVPEAPARCGSCGTHLVPGSEEADEVASWCLSGTPVPVPRCPRTFTSYDEVAWAPEAAPRGGGWRFTLHAGVAERLRIARAGMLALRIQGGAVLFVDAIDVEEAEGWPTGHRRSFTVRAREPTVLRVGAARIPGRLLPWTA